MQSLSNPCTVQQIFDIAISIGNSLDLCRMLDQSLAAYLVSLDATGAVAWETHTSETGRWQMTPVHALPKTGALDRIANVLESRLTGEDPATLAIFYDTPPIYDTGPAGNILILPLPDYGALALIRSRGNWKKTLVDRLEPLDRKLAQACIACRQNRALEREVAEHRRTSADLSREKAYLDQLFDNAQVGIVMANNDGTVMRVNPEFVRIFGHPAGACIGKNIDALVSREGDQQAASEITRAVSHGEKHDFEAVRFRADGSTVHVMVLASPIVLQGEQVAVYAFYRDITASKRLAAELIRAKKLEATGLMAGGVAHDFNNMLAAIMGAIELSRMDVPADSAADRNLARALRQCADARDLTRRFISFSSADAPRKRVIDLEPMIRAAINEVFCDTAVSARLETADDLPAVEADPDQMRHVFLALMRNAKEAQADHGTVWIRVDAVSARDLPAELGPCDGKDPYVRIAVTDRGKGIPEDVLPKIFDPYYSTKRMGVQKGMGMGLTIAHAVVTRHGGIIQVNSQEGVGTSVVICLPAVPGPE